MSSASRTKNRLRQLRLFSRRYRAALEIHLKKDPASSLEDARELGVRSVTLELTILELARLHEEALTALAAPRDSARAGDAMIRRAGEFFAEAAAPIEEAHLAAREVNSPLTATNEALKKRTEELAASNEALKREILKRQTMEDALITSESTTSQLLQKSRHLQEELRHLSRQLLSAQEEERKRISRELHDVVAQALTGINIRLAAMKSQATANSKDLVNSLATAQRLMEESVDIVHRFARDLRPAVLDDIGLIPALRTYLNGVMKRTGIRFALSAAAEIEKLGSSKRTMLFRVAQEAVINIVRHAKASKATVTVHQHLGAVRMEIQDDGKGFDVESVLSGEIHKRLGLVGMRERVEMVGGSFCVESSSGKSTTIRVEIPQAGGGAAPKKRRPKKRSARHSNAQESNHRLTG